MQFALVFIFIGTYIVRDLSLAISMPSVESNKFAALGIAINVVNNHFFKVEDTQLKRVNRIGSKASLVNETSKRVDQSLDTQKKKKKTCFNFKGILDDGYTLLMLASYNGNIKAVEFLLALKSDVNDMTVYGETALTLASRQGHSRIVDLLLQHGADFNLTILDGVNALMLASLYGHQDAVEVFLNYGANVNAETGLNISAVEMAVHKNHTNVVELFLKYNTRNKKQAIKKKTLENAFFHASIYGLPNIVKLFLKYNIYNTNNINIGAFAALEKYQHSVLKVYFQHFDVNSIQYKSFTLLQYASAKGDDLNVKFLLENKADVNKVLPDREITPLMLATESGHLSTVKLLLKYKANVNYVTKELFSALMFAINNKDENIVETLLQHKADVNHRYSGETSALSFAVSKGSLVIVKLLLKYGADVNQVSNIRVSALMVAAEKGLDDIVKFLLENKANVHIKEIVYERNALISASNKGRVGTVQLLLKHGARVDDVNVFGYTSLMAAAEQGHDLVVELLIKNGADINKRHMRNVNALMLAVYSGRARTVKLLLKHNAKVNRIIVNLALKKRRVFIVKLLRDKIKEKYIKRQRGVTLKQSHKNTKTTAFNQDRATNSGTILWYLLLILFILIVLLVGKHLINKLSKRNTTVDQLYQENIISTIWEHFYKITDSPLHLQNVWGCDKTCQPNESGFFRLLNFRGKLHSSTHVQEVSPNCYGCLVTKIHMSTIDVLYLESFLLLQYISIIAKTIHQMFQIANDKVSLVEMENIRHIYKITIEISLAFQSDLNINRSNYTKGSFKKQLETLNSKFVQQNFQGRSKVQQLFRKRQNQIRITEPQLICSMLGLNELFENYLLELDMESINHQTLVYFLNRWLENTVQAIEETDRSISLYDCMLRIGLSEDKATTYIGYLCEEFINMYSSLYWLSRYFENLCLMNPLITEIYRTCLFEGDFNVWKSGQVQRVNNNQNFELKFLNQKSPVRLDNHDIDSTCERVSRYLKKQKDKDSLFLFHGTSLLSAVNILERGINLVKGKQNLDFSHAKGFYVINNLRKSVEWSCTHKPELHAVVIFKLKKMEMDNGNGLVLEDEREWGDVVTACRKGFENDNGPDVEDRLQNVDFVRGFICANGREVHRNNHNPVIMEERDGYRPLQTCILNKDYARWFGSPANIFGLVVFRNG